MNEESKAINKLINGGSFTVDGIEYIGIVSFEQDGKKVERVFLPYDPRWDEDGNPWKSQAQIQTAIEKAVRKTLASGMTLR